MHNNSGSCHEVTQWIGLPFILRTPYEYLALSMSMQTEKDLNLCHLCSLSYCETQHWIVTWRGVSMPLVPSTFARSWSITGSHRLLHENEEGDTSLVSEINSGYMDMWHGSWMPIMLIGLFLLKITLIGGDQGDAHITQAGRSWSILPRVA